MNLTKHIDLFAGGIYVPASIFFLGRDNRAYKEKDKRLREYLNRPVRATTADGQHFVIVLQLQSPASLQPRASVPQGPLLGPRLTFSRWQDTAARSRAVAGSPFVPRSGAPLSRGGGAHGGAAAHHSMQVYTAELHFTSLLSLLNSPFASGAPVSHHVANPVARPWPVEASRTVPTAGEKARRVLRRHRPHILSESSMKEITALQFPPPQITPVALLLNP